MPGVGPAVTPPMLEACRPGPVTALRRGRCRSSKVAVGPSVSSSGDEADAGDAVAVRRRPSGRPRCPANLGAGHRGWREPVDGEVTSCAPARHRTPRCRRRSHRYGPSGGEPEVCTRPAFVVVPDSVPSGGERQPGRQRAADRHDLPAWASRSSCSWYVERLSGGGTTARGGRSPMRGCVGGAVVDVDVAAAGVDPGACPRCPARRGSRSWTRPAAGGAAPAAAVQPAARRRRRRWCRPRWDRR